MASTRNRNTPGDYRLEQQNKSHYKSMLIHEHSRPVSEANPTHMMNYGSMSRDSLSSNAVDIESDMFGIGSTNLVDGYTAPIPELKNVGSVDFSERNGVVLERTPDYLKHQRPLMR